jgi:hypothetical protein
MEMQPVYEANIPRASSGNRATPSGSLIAEPCGVAGL